MRPDKTVFKSALMLLGPNGERWTKDKLFRDEEGVGLESWRWENAPPVKPAKMCALGALCVATNSLNSRSPEADLLQDVLRRKCTHRFMDVASFNDRPETTFEDVRLLFKEAMRECDERQAEKVSGEEGVSVVNDLHP